MFIKLLKFILKHVLQLFQYFFYIKNEQKIILNLKILVYLVFYF